jgi:hypothetical protein
MTFDMNMTSTPIWGVDPVHILRDTNAAGTGVGDALSLPPGVAAAALRAGVNEDVAEEAQQRQQQLLQQAVCGNRAMRFRPVLRHVAAVYSFRNTLASSTCSQEPHCIYTCMCIRRASRHLKQQSLLRIISRQVDCPSSKFKDVSLLPMLLHD